MLYFQTDVRGNRMIELMLVGIFIGTMSGFFGIGGGMILVPILLVLGFVHHNFP